MLLKTNPIKCLHFSYFFQVSQKMVRTVPDKNKWYSDRSFMCYDEPLVLVKEKKTWEEALKHCRSLEPVDPSQPATAYQNYRYDLATLLTQDDHAFAREKACVTCVSETSKRQ